ncbi:RdlA protein [Streptomyces cinnamoneus]|uniref:RdlA protein n=1 Tax=Streptomyces cinnamoneus TaxID=53446 RepID=A0A2G1XNG9_STRCJ|nr:rodlin [Streptomyces cinnamoneus]PHQ52795.1 RdlA protein [Streptomyces cinnamoneus]PPT11897.1 RdlA protein [Streptomyces cinnamoneus]
MFKKVLTTVALTATAVGAAAVPTAALERDGRHVANGNDSVTAHGNTVTGGHRSPQMTAVQGSLDKLCVGVGKLGLQSLLLLINIGVQDIPVLTSQQQQQCTDNSTIVDGDDPLSHLLDEIPVVSGNGSGNRDGDH